jgi:capsular exopolysaccharide synthesis family protein
MHTPPPPNLLPPRWVDDRHAAESEPWGDPSNRGSGRDGLVTLLLESIALARRHWLIVSLCLAGSLGWAVHQRRTERPSYRARAVIQLRDKGEALSNGLSTMSRNADGADAVLSQIQVLQSRTIARVVAHEEGLRLRMVSPELSTASVDDVTVAPTAREADIHLSFGAGTVVASAGGGEVRAPYGTPIELAGARFTIVRRPAIDEAQMAIVPIDAAADEVLASLRGQSRDRTTIIDVTYVAHDPVIAQRVANRAVQVFQDMNARNEKQQTVRRREFIQQQLDKTEAAHSEAQLEYTQFAARAHVFNAADMFKAQQSAIADVDSRKQQLDAERRGFVAALDSLQDPALNATFLARVSVLVGSTGLSANPLVTSLYTELSRLEAARDTIGVGPMALAMTNPQVKRIDTLISTTRIALVKALTPQLATMGARISALDELHTRFAADLATLPTVEAQESALRAHVETYGRQVDRLRDALQLAQIDEAAVAGQVEIIDPATTPAAVLNAGKTSTFVLAGLLGLVMGVGFGYVLENRKDVIRGREELDQVSPLPNLALVPQIRSLARHNARWTLPRFARFERSRKKGAAVKPTAVVSGGNLVTVADGRSTGAEAYRTLRTNLLFSDAVQSLRRVVVSSAEPQEGKSTTAANLAVACAQQGQRVLLIDADLRNARVHTLFSRPRAPGLTNVLVGTVPLADGLRTTGIDGLTILTSGTTPPNPAELLGSTRMRQLLDELGTQFDLIVIDTPPLLAASDAAILGRISDGTLMVVRAGQTQRAAVQEGIQQLVNVGARLLGTVLNDPDAEVAKYSPYYRPHYYYDYYRAQTEKT